MAKYNEIYADEGEVSRYATLNNEEYELRFSVKDTGVTNLTIFFDEPVGVFAKCVILDRAKMEELISDAQAALNDMPS